LIISSSMDLAMFRMHLQDNTTLSQGSIFEYTTAISKFLSDDPDINSVEAYNKFILDYTFKKRCTHYYSAIRAYIKFKFPKNRDTRDKLFDNLQRPRIRKDFVRERRHLTEDQILAVINNIELFKHRVIAIIQHLTGVRFHDVASLKSGSIVYEEYEDKKTMRLNLIGKGGKRNVVYIFDRIAMEIIEYYTQTAIGAEDYYFLTYTEFKRVNSFRRGSTSNIYLFERKNYQQYNLDIKQALDKCNVLREEWASHDFRRSFARRFWERYKDLQALQQIMRHSSPNTTVRYLEQSGLQNIDYYKEMQA